MITINYTMPNETVVSTHPIGDEFFGLSSTLLDPITAAFYDRYTNEIYFFKGKPDLNILARGNELFSSMQLPSPPLVRKSYSALLFLSNQSLIL